VVHCLVSLLQAGVSGDSLQPSSTLDSSACIILKTPQKLTALTLLCKTQDRKGLNTNNRQTLRFMHGALPTSLRSLSVCGIAAHLQAPYNADTSSNAAGWPVV
jgi:hypothetical protein